MKILVISPGKGHEAWAGDAIGEYEKRLSKKFSLEWAHPSVGTKEEEGAAILKLLKDGDVVVLLDERGKDIDTPGLAKLLERHLVEGTKRLVIIIGGAYGVSDEVKARAQATYKLSSLVFPHMLVRVLLAEQLYRVSSILEGGKYHHA